MTASPRFMWPLLAAITATPALHGALAAQSAVLRGRVLDPAGNPVGGVAVVLHGVSDAAGGAELGRTTTDAAGNFGIPLRAADDGTVYFAATRFAGSLYVGTPFRDPDRPPADYVIVVGANAVAGPGASPARSAAPRSAAPGVLPWWLALVLGAPAIGAVFLPLLPRGRPYAVRTLLVELAELEERHARGAAGTDPERQRRYEAERVALRARLRATPESTASHAADQH